MAKTFGYGNGHYTFIYATPSVPFNETLFNDDDYIKSIDASEARNMRQFVLIMKVCIFSLSFMIKHKTRMFSLFLDKKNWKHFFLVPEGGGAKYSTRNQLIAKSET